MVSRSPRQPSARPSGRRGAGKGRGTSEAEAKEAAAAGEDIAERAARLGITAERVLEEYARIAFADLRHFVEWGPQGYTVKAPDALSDADAAAISEIAGVAGGKYRIKLYNKKAALDAIARHLGMFAPAPRGAEDDAAPDPAEDAREVLARRLARLAAGGAAP